MCARSIRRELCERVQLRAWRVRRGVRLVRLPRGLPGPVLREALRARLLRTRLPTALQLLLRRAYASAATRAPAAGTPATAPVDDVRPTGRARRSRRGSGVAPEAQVDAHYLELECRSPRQTLECCFDQSTAVRGCCEALTARVAARARMRRRRRPLPVSARLARRRLRYAMHAGLVRRRVPPRVQLRARRTLRPTRRQLPLCARLRWALLRINYAAFTIRSI